MQLLPMLVVCLCVSQVLCHCEESRCPDGGEEPPKDCIMNKSEALRSYETVEDFDHCAPYFMPNVSRMFYLAAAGRRVTYRENKCAYQRFRILPEMLRDVSNLDTSVTVLGNRIRFPVGASPTALQKLASKQGELDAVKATCHAGTVMILSCYASTLLEDVAKAAPKALKWMQLHIFADRRYTMNLIQRAEANGFKAIVVTVDSPVQESITSRGNIFRENPANVTYVNVLVLNGVPPNPNNPSLTFEDLSWLKRNTRLPVVVKGILTPEDAVQAVHSGASAILVSNHGGRELDSVPATIDVLPRIADAILRETPWAEVYVDGGIRNGFDVFKALGRGARAVFIGRPVAWGLAAGGKEGADKVFDILRRELKETMTLAGTRNVNQIRRDMVIKENHRFCCRC